MSISRSKSTNPCPVCWQLMDSVHMKSPHIDDNADECVNPACEYRGGAEEILRAVARSAARAEEARDRDYERGQDEEDNSDNNEKDD